MENAQLQTLQSGWKYFLTSAHGLLRHVIIRGVGSLSQGFHFSISLPHLSLPYLSILSSYRMSGVRTAAWNWELGCLWSVFQFFRQVVLSFYIGIPFKQGESRVLTERSVAETPKSRRIPCLLPFFSFCNRHSFGDEFITPEGVPYIYLLD